MILDLISFDGNNINDGTNYDAWFPRETPMQPNANAIFVQRAGAFPVYAGKTFPEQDMTIAVKAVSNINSNLEQLNKWFDVSNETPKQLIAQDTANSNRQYYLYGTPKSVSQLDGEGTLFITLALSDPIWQSVTQESTSWSIVSTDTNTYTTSVTIDTNSEVYPVLEITPTLNNPSAAGWNYRREIQILPTSTNAWVNRPIDIFETTDGFGLDTAALVSGGKMQADGDDIRVFVNGQQWDYWLTTDLNTTDTSCGIVLTMPPKSEMTLGTAIASTDTITSIAVSVTQDNYDAWARMPNSGRVIINSEEFTYTSKSWNATLYGFTVNSRAVRDTTAGNHAAGDLVRWLPYTVTLLYGNSAATSDATIDARYQPIIDFTTSSNSSFVMNEFGASGSLRQPNWDGRVVSAPIGTQSKIYTSTHGTGTTDVNITNASPYTVAGMFATNYKVSTAWKAATVNETWTATFPDGISSISLTGEEYHTVANGVTFKVQTSADGGTTFQNAASTTPSGTLSQWNAVTLASSDVTISGTPTIVQFQMQAGLPAVASQYGAFGVTTTTIGLTNIPEVRHRAEQGIYNMRATFSTSDGNSFQIVHTMNVNETLYIDCDPNFPTVKFNGVRINGSLVTSSVRPKWLAIQPGTSTLTYSDATGGNLTVAIKFRYRSNWL